MSKRFIAKLYEIEAEQFNGQANMQVLDDNHDHCRVFSSMRGHFIKHPNGDVTPLKKGQWVITHPFFKVMDDKQFRALFEEITDADH